MSLITDASFARNQGLITFPNTTTRNEVTTTSAAKTTISTTTAGVTTAITMAILTSCSQKNKFLHNTKRNDSEYYENIRQNFKLSLKAKKYSVREVKNEWKNELANKTEIGNV